MFAQVRDIFDRKIKVHVRDRIIEFPDIYISGEIKFGNTDKDISEIRIYNVAPHTVTVFKENNNIRVLAGYGDSVGTIIEGTIKTYEPLKESTDVNHTLKIIPRALAALNQKYVKSWEVDTPAEIIAKSVIEDCGLKVGVLNLPVKKYKHKTVDGLAKDVLQGIADDCNLKFYTQGSYVFMLPHIETYKATIIVTSNTGLLETPKEITKEKKNNVGVDEVNEGLIDKISDFISEMTPGANNENPDLTDLGTTLDGITDDTPRWRVRTFLNHEITTDSILKISSRSINGLYRVIEGKHGLDDFVTDVEVVKYEGAS